MKTRSLLITAAVVFFHHSSTFAAQLASGSNDGRGQMPSILAARNGSLWGLHNEPPMSGWHPRRIELDHLASVRSIQPHRLEIVVPLSEVAANKDEFGLATTTTPILAKLAALPKDLEALAREDTMYRLLYGLGVTPRFLGHVTVDGRIVGFLTELVPSGVEQGRTTRGRLKAEACLAALRRVHGKGIAHGDAHGENCLARGDGSAVLIDFELALETSAQAEFDRDLWIMAHTAGD